MNAKLYFAALFFFVNTILCAQQQQQEITIHNCLARALNHNLGIKIKSFEPLIAQKDIAITQGAFDPVITFDFAYENSTDAVVQQFQLNDIVIQDVFEKDTEAIVYSGGVMKRHQFGGSIGIFQNFNYLKNAFDNEENDSVFNYETELRITQSLLRNFGIDPNTANYRVAQNNLKIAKYQHTNKILNIFAEVQLTYLDLVNAIENVRLQKEALKLSHRFYDITKMQVKAGAIPAIDLLDAERDIAEKQDNLVVAERNVIYSEDRLKSIIQPSDLNYYENIRLLPIEIPNLRKNNINFEETIKYAINHRMDIKQGRINLKNADINIAFRKNQLLPKLDLTVNVGLQGQDNEHAAALEQIYNIDQVSWGVQLSLEVPIGNRIANNRYQKNILQKKRLLVEYQDLENRVIFEIRNNIRSLATSRRRITTAEKTREIAERQITIQKKKYRAGVISLYRLQNTEKSLTEAKVNEINAIVAHQKAVVNLERSQWALPLWLQRYDIQLPFVAGSY
ncbi:TolC family protein [Candidatus Uabimicrobium sp. HlEnr_7]|uniref:TolC family protein n=1 Tax=Candidatus Uabimicrobium helgolandensis TaxID=3095367 RepID=UPI0035566A69